MSCLRFQTILLGQIILSGNVVLAYALMVPVLFPTKEQMDMLGLKEVIDWLATANGVRSVIPNRWCRKVYQVVHELIIFFEG